MNTKRFQQALNTIAMGFAEAAEALNDTTGGQPVGPVAAPPAAAPASFDSLEFDLPQPSLADELVEFAPEGALAVCPAHRTPYKDGNYGPFCPQKGSEPAWTNRRGYCTINPKNAAEYLRGKAAVA